MTGRTARGFSLGLAIGVVLAGVTPASAAFAAPVAVRAAAPLPGGLGPCVPGNCPPVWPEPNNMAPTGTDNAVNVFVGGDFRVRERAAEAEGRVVVLGGFDMAKSSAGSSIYNIGIVGVGSQVQPPAGSDFLATGGNVSVATGQSLLADGGVVRYAGTLTGTVTGTKTQDAAAVTPYTGLRAQLTAASKCYARVDGQPRTATGTALNEGYRTLFTGDNSSSLQVFNVTADLAGNAGAQQDLQFAGIPAGATILVNVLGDNPLVNISTGVIPGIAKEKLLWNFPDAETVRLIGSGQFQGSTLIAEPSSETTVELPGMNGRFFTSGGLTHTSSATGGGGQEFHSYPFTGDLPDCAGTVPVTGDVSVVKVDSETDEVLAGAVFELWKETNGTAGLQTAAAGGDTKVSDCTTPASGVCSSTQEVGTYYWRETAAPPGHDLPANPVFGPLVLTAENASAGVSVRAENDETVVPPVTGAVSVLKVDSETDAALPGAVFELWKETNGTAGLQTAAAGGDTKLSDCTTPANGTCSSTQEPGTYYWRETAAPPGHDLPANPVFGPLVLTAENADAGVQVRAENDATVVPPLTGTVSVRKVDADTGDALPGAVFELWHETNDVPGLQTAGATPDTKLTDCTTPANGTCTSTQEAGTYYWRETAAPAGHDLPANPVFGPLVLDPANGRESVEVTARNRKTTGDVSVLKVDSETGEALSGAVFELWRETNGMAGLQTIGINADEKVTDCTTPANGICSSTQVLGTYYWRETTAPAGHDLPANPVFGPLALTAENASTGVRVRAENNATVVPPQTGDVTVVKTDERTGAPLAGASFTLWRETNGVTGLQTGGADPDTSVSSDCVTGANGVCGANVPPGTYYWQETEAPAGYELPANPVAGPLVLTAENTGTGVTVTAVNKKAQKPPYTGAIKVRKKDAKTGMPLRGAVFDLWRETNRIPGLQTTGMPRDTLVGGGCATDRQGVCAFDRLPEGDYYLRETDVPEGYVLPAHPVTGPLHISKYNKQKWLTVHVDNKRGEHGKGKGKGGHGKGGHGKGGHGKGEHGKGEHGKNEHGKGEHGKGEHGRGEHGRGEHGRGDSRP